MLIPIARARVASTVLVFFRFPHSTDSGLSGTMDRGAFGVGIFSKIREYSRFRTDFTAVCLDRQADSLFSICLAQISHYRPDLRICYWEVYIFDREKIIGIIFNLNGN